jgi:hypothetical protein
MTCGVVLAIASTAFAQPPPSNTPAGPPDRSEINPDTNELLLIPSRALTVKLDGNLTPTFSKEGVADSRPHAPKSAGDRETFVPMDLGGMKIEPGLVAFSLYSSSPTPAEPATVLVVANGSEKGLIYVAGLVLKQGDRFIVRKTTICAIGANAIGVETWNEEVSAIFVFKVLHAEPGICIDAETGKAYRSGDQPPPPDAKATPKTPSL